MTSINPKILKTFLNELYPVGKTEIFLDNKDHSNYMGFTWQRDAVGKAIVGIDSNDTDFNTIGKTGGSKALQSHAHELQTSEGANYSGLVSTAYSGNTGWAVTADAGTRAGGNVLGGTTRTAGQGNSGNLQPYKVFAIWVRTA